MYGQTEATARMAYLPPDLAAEPPRGRRGPRPRGSFRLDPADGSTTSVGELVYSGPNVMMGYAESPADLARGPSSPSCAPVTSLDRPTTGCGRSSAGSDATPSCSASGSTSTASSGISRDHGIAARRARARRPARGLHRAARATAARTRRAVLALTGLPASAVRVPGSTGCPTRRPASPTTPRWPARRATSATSRRRRSGDRRAHPRPVRRAPRPPRRDGPRQLRRPRRRLAVLRRGLHAPRPGARHAAAGLAAPAPRRPRGRTRDAPAGSRAGRPVGACCAPSPSC